ncbi:hypothetical protein, partial [Streptomyces sp. NPDC056387]|uniref:hypothetical protein n=1 Tax=Streptomyces sp. NPDC056387 TaxID=3345803 RepID=UPI0035DF26AA
VGGAEALHSGAATHAVNFSGGLHHAMPGSAAGFCVGCPGRRRASWDPGNGPQRIRGVRGVEQ